MIFIWICSRLYATYYFRGFTLEEKRIYALILEMIPSYQALMPFFEGHSVAFERFVDLVSAYMQLTPDDCLFLKHRSKKAQGIHALATPTLANLRCWTSGFGPIAWSRFYENRASRLWSQQTRNYDEVGMTHSARSCLHPFACTRIFLKTHSKLLVFVLITHGIVFLIGHLCKVSVAQRKRLKLPNFRRSFILLTPIQLNHSLVFYVVRYLFG